jgi:ornithine cyclodeaminase
MIVLTSDQIIGLLPSSALIAAVERAAMLLQTDQVIVPDRVHLHWGDSTLLAMPALAGDVYGTKLVSIHPQNSGRGLPVTDGLMMLNAADTGRPLALLNAGALTARRTGAVGAMALKRLTPETTASVGIVGCGVQGTWQAIFACAVRPVKEVSCLGRSPANVARFQETVARHVPGIRITVCQDADELLARTDVVIAATTASEPVLPDDPARLAGKHFFSIGSYRPEMQEFPDSVYRLAGRLAIDSDAARREVGDIINPVRKGLLQESEVVHIGDLVAGRRTFDPTQTTAFKSVGLAVYDVCVAQALFQEAVRLGIGQEVTL